MHFKDGITNSTDVTLHFLKTNDQQRCLEEKGWMNYDVFAVAAIKRKI